jgi:hypothetical protein
VERHLVEAVAELCLGGGFIPVLGRPPRAALDHQSSTALDHQSGALADNKSGATSDCRSGTDSDRCLGTVSDKTWNPSRLRPWLCGIHHDVVSIREP